MIGQNDSRTSVAPNGVGYTELLDMTGWFAGAVTGAVLVVVGIVWIVTSVRPDGNVNRPGFDYSAGRSVKQYEQVDKQGRAVPSLSIRLFFISRG